MRQINFNIPFFTISRSIMNREIALIIKNPTSLSAVGHMTISPLYLHSYYYSQNTIISKAPAIITLHPFYTTKPPCYGWLVLYHNYCDDLSKDALFDTISRFIGDFERGGALVFVVSIKHYNCYFSDHPSCSIHHKKQIHAH